MMARETLGSWPLARRRDTSVSMTFAPVASLALLVLVFASTSAVSTNGQQPKRRRSRLSRDHDGAATAPIEVGEPQAPAILTAPTWGARLLASPRLQDRLRLLCDLGLSDAEIATAFPDGGSARSIRRWRLHGMDRDREGARWRPIDDLCAIVGYLMSDGTFDEDATLAWLRSRHPQLGQRIPLEVLGEARNGFDEVLDAAEWTLGVIVASPDEEPGPIERAIAAGDDRPVSKAGHSPQARV
jgi:hypothetical protein